MRSEDEMALRRESAGWLEMLERFELPPEALSLLPTVCDRFEEARHFLRLTLELAPESANVQRANWYAGSHLTAVIAIEDAVKVDYRTRARTSRTLLWGRSSSSIPATPIR